jgi:thiol-disulfide isomerase/thioredoxin
MASSELRQRKGAPAAPSQQAAAAVPAPAAPAAPAPPPSTLRPINYEAFDALLSTTLVRKAAGAGGAGASAAADAPLERLLLREALGGDAADGVSLYFSAHWCPPCRAFTPELAQMHARLTGQAGGGGGGGGGGANNQNNSNNKKRWPVIFVSMDRSAAAFHDYFASMPQSWLAIPFEDDQLRSVLLRKMKVEGIPTLAMLDPSCAGVEAANARAAVSADPEGSVFPWRGAACGGAGPGGLLGNPRMLMMVLMLVYYAFVNALLPWWRARGQQQQQQGAAGGGGGGGVV